MAETLGTPSASGNPPRGGLDDHRDRLTRNTAYLTAAFVVQKVLSSGYYLIYANLAGPATVGAFLFAVSLASLVGIVIDLGLSPILIREVAKDPAAAPRLLRATFRFKLVTALACLVVLAAIAPLVTTTPLQRELLVFTALFTVIESFSLSAYGVLRGLQELKPEAIGTTLAQLTPLVIGATGLAVTQDPRWLGIALVAAGLTNVAYAVTALRRRLGPQWLGAPGPLPWSASTIAPFAVSGVLQRVYASVDVVLVGVLASAVAVGLYSTAFRFAYALQFLPLALNTGLYPALSRAAREATGSLEVLTERAFRVLLALALPLSIVLIVHARALLAALFPAYVDATLALQISLASLPPLFVNFLLSSLLNATDRQARQTSVLAAVVVVNVALNLLLIPRLAQVGASIAAVAATTVYTLAGARAAGRALQLHRGTLTFALRLAAAAVVAGLAGWVVGQVVHVFVSLTVSTLVAAGGVIAFGAYRLADLRPLLTAFRRRTA